MSLPTREKTAMDRVHLDTDVYSLGLERTAQVLATHDGALVSFSGGKDSTAVLQLALEVIHGDRKRFGKFLPLRVVHYDEEAIPYETEEYVRRIAERDDVDLEWYCLPVQHRNACSRTSPWWWPWAPEDQDKWCRPLPPEAITTLAGFPIWPPESRLSIPDSTSLIAPPHLGNVALLMGIRAQESLTRMRALLHADKREYNYVVPCGGTPNVWKAYPIYDWLTPDVWTAPAVKGWDHNHAYDRLEMAGVTHHSQRCSPAFGEEPLKGLHTYAQCFPEVWAKMAERVPGVGAAARYARTELYAFGDRPEKPAGMPWPEFILHYLAKFRPGDVKTIAARLKDEMRRHYRKTTTPILEKTKHPDTGVSWEWLLMVSMRGDFKGRKSPMEGPWGHARQAELWPKYAQELAELVRAGRYQELAAPVAPPPDPYALIPSWVHEYLANAAVQEATP